MYIRLCIPQQHTQIDTNHRLIVSLITEQHNITENEY